MLNQRNNTYQWAIEQDRLDPLQGFRERFFIPVRNEKPLIYFCGNSLGLQPKIAHHAIQQELTKWQNLGVEGWFEEPKPWVNYHEACQNILANIVGASTVEVCPMHQLTVNLHLMMTSFYQPTADRYKILTIAADFPSDQYALETHLKARGFDPESTLIEVTPRTGEFTIQLQDLLNAIYEHGSELALVCMSGLHYYTGQVFDMAAIAKAAHEVGALVGFDLAHAIGNVPLSLHDWDVDFAVWCSYKYLNSGPGGIGGAFIHTKHHTHNDLARLAGWWGYQATTRFEMKKGFRAEIGAAGWQVSTPNIMALAIHYASLQIFEEAGIKSLREKSKKLTAFLITIIEQANAAWGFEKIKIMTPRTTDERGAQLSLLIDTDGKEFFEKLTSAGVIGDWREPNCIRLAPAPLYNTFEEVWQAGNLFYPSSAR